MLKSSHSWFAAEIYREKVESRSCESGLTFYMQIPPLINVPLIKVRFQVEIICNDMELGTDFTLLFIRETIADEEVS